MTMDLTPQPVNKPRISAELFNAAQRILADRPDLTNRIQAALIVATDLNVYIDPNYRATRHTCHCPDALFRGSARGSLGLCKHSLGIRLAGMVSA